MTSKRHLEKKCQKLLIQKLNINQFMFEKHTYYIYQQKKKLNTKGLADEHTFSIIKQFYYLKFRKLGFKNDVNLRS